MSDHRLSCWDRNCAAIVFLTEEQFRQHRERGTVFHCAAGHEQVFRPSEIDKLREHVVTLEQQAAALRRALDEERKTWKCPHAGCWYRTSSKGAAARHVAKHYGAKPIRGLLPADAGPDALNSEVY